jgi:hypothetical protein
MTFSAKDAAVITRRVSSVDYSPILFSRIVVAAAGRNTMEKKVIVVVPYGEPWTTCFTNGNDVFNQLVFTVDDKGLVGAEDRRFKECRPSFSPIPFLKRPVGPVVGKM